MVELSRSAKVAKDGLLYSPRRRASRNLSKSVSVLGHSDKYSRRLSAEDDIGAAAMSATMRLGVVGLGERGRGRGGKERRDSGEKWASGVIKTYVKSD